MRLRRMMTMVQWKMTMVNGGDDGGGGVGVGIFWQNLQNLEEKGRAGRKPRSK